MIRCRTEEGCRDDAPADNDASPPNLPRRPVPLAGISGQPTGKLRGANVLHMIAFPKSQMRLMEQLSPEIITMLGVGIAVIGLVLQQGRRLDRRIDALALHMDERDRRTDEWFRQLTDQMNEQFLQMNEQFRKLGERVARVEGKFDLLETFVEHRKEPPAEAAE